VSSTKRNPAEPERGTIATGPHTPERNGEGSAGNGRAGGAAAEPAAEGAEAVTPDEGTAVTGADIVASETPSLEGDGARTTDATATTRLRVPTPPGSTPSADGKADAEPAADSTPAAPTLDPVSAVPPPGPAAAQPPPWRRMPGHDNDGREAPVASSADNLLDEGPTAFLEAPGFIPPPAREAGSAAVSETGGWARATTRTRPPRQAALQLRRLDPWSVLKLALVLAVVLFFIWLVAVGVLYGVLDGMGVWDRLNGTYADLVSGEAQTGSTLISAGRVFGLAAVIGAINSLLFAVAVTVGAFVYNVSADLVGGIEVTLSERD
jgi:hypothetical protein